MNGPMRIFPPFSKKKKRKKRQEKTKTTAKAYSAENTFDKNAATLTRAH